MVESSVMLSLPQMVDLALHSPEVGAVNFNILHTLLHVIIQQIDLLHCKVEFRGHESETIQGVIASTKPGPTLNLTEYIVTTPPEEKSRPKKVKAGEAPKTSKEEVTAERELRVIEQRKDSKQEPLTHPQAMAQLSTTSMQKVVLVEPTREGDGTAPHVTVALSRVHFDNMEEELEKLKEEIRELKELPANMGLIDALRNADVDKSSPVVDMFQILTLVKRVEATETSISKLASIFEDLAREHSAAGLLGSATILKKASDLHVQMQSFSSKTGSISAKVNEKVEQLEKRVTALEEGGGAIKDILEKASKMAGEDGGATKDVEETSKMGGDDKECARLTNLENKFDEYAENMSSINNLFTQHVTVLQAQFTDLEKEIGEIVERMNSSGVGAIVPGGDISGDHDSIKELYNKFLLMQVEMENVTTTAQKLLEDKEERQMQMDALLEQVELLKTIKADREDLEDALADKADTRAVNRKVSHDQFESTCDDLSRSIEDALGRLTQQAQLWQQALDDIQHEIENKLDKMELTPLKDFVTSKLKVLQDRLKALTALKKESEAAGTKSKFLRNVNCISCDKDVIMRKQHDPTTMPPPPALPPTKSMAPYLAYELDALRKQQKCAPHSRNMHHFESAMTGGAKLGGNDDHICNRYCGGSHTVTTPQQRVTRLGHFLQQWGPETQAIDGQLRGTDGQWYKTREGSGDMTPGKEQIKDIEPDPSHMASMRSRPSMVVQGGILSSRTGGKDTGRHSSAGKATKEEILSHISFKESAPPPPPEQDASAN